MSKSDNTMPWKLVDDEMEAELGHRWFIIVNTSSTYKSSGRNSFKNRELRRWWHGERRRVRNDLRNAQYRRHSLYGADQPLETRPRNGVLSDLL